MLNEEIQDDDKLILNRAEAIAVFDQQIEIKRKELNDLLDKKTFCEQQYMRYTSD